MIWEERYCKQHPNIAATFFCLDQTCSRGGPICKICFDTHHIEHEPKFEFEQVKQYVMKLRELTEEKVEDTQYQDQMVKNLRNWLQKLENNVHNLQQKFNKQIKKLAEKIQSIKDGISEDVEDIFDYLSFFQEHSHDDDLLINNSICGQPIDMNDDYADNPLFSLKVKDFRLQQQYHLSNQIKQRISFHFNKFNKSSISSLKKLERSIKEQTTQQISEQSSTCLERYLYKRYKEDSVFQQLANYNNINNSVIQSGFQTQQQQAQTSIIYDQFSIDNRKISSSINVSIEDQMLSQNGSLERYAFLYPTFNEALFDEEQQTQNSAFIARIKIISQKFWMGFGVTERSTHNLQYSQIQDSGYIISLNGFVQSPNEPPTKQFESVKINKGDVISISYQPNQNNTQIIELWKNQETMIHRIEGNLFSDKKKSPLCFVIGLLKGDKVQLLRSN